MSAFMWLAGTAVWLIAVVTVRRALQAHAAARARAVPPVLPHASLHSVHRLHADVDFDLVPLSAPDETSATHAGLAGPTHRPPPHRPGITPPPSTAPPSIPNHAEPRQGADPLQGGLPHPRVGHPPAGGHATSSARGDQLAPDGRPRKDRTRLYAVESGAAAQPDGAVEAANVGGRPGSPSAAVGSDGAAGAAEGRRSSRPRRRVRLR